MRRREAIGLLAAPVFAADDFATFTDVAKAAGLSQPIIEKFPADFGAGFASCWQGS